MLRIIFTEAQNYTDKIIRPHVKPHIDNRALADGAAFMQGGPTPHTARLSQEVLIGAAIDVLVWSAKNPDINIIKKVWSVMLKRINGVNPLPKNAIEIHATCTVYDRTSHIGAHTTISGQRSAPTSCLCRSSRWTHLLSLNSWMDFWSSHYLRVKFVLRLMHAFHALIHVLKTYNERAFYPINAYKNYFTKNWKLFFCSIPWKNGYLQ